MRRMFIFHNCEHIHRIIGPVTVRFTSSVDEEIRVRIDIDCALAQRDFRDSIPTSTFVEMYVKRADLMREGEAGHDWVFEESWQAPRTPEQAIAEKYGVPVVRLNVVKGTLFFKRTSDRYECTSCVKVFEPHEDCGLEMQNHAAAHGASAVSVMEAGW